MTRRQARRVSVGEEAQAVCQDAMALRGRIAGANGRQDVPGGTPEPAAARQAGVTDFGDRTRKFPDARTPTRRHVPPRGYGRLGRAACGGRDRQ